MKKITLSKLKKRIQRKFNLYIRLRDKDLPCISCSSKIGPWNAGHFFSVKGNDRLRFNFDNVHKECAKCNGFDQSHLIYYYDNLKIKIGQDRIDNLKKAAIYNKKHNIKWTRDELLQIEKNIEEKLNENIR